MEWITIRLKEGDDIPSRYNVSGTIVDTEFDVTAQEATVKELTAERLIETGYFEEVPSA